MSSAHRSRDRKTDHRSLDQEGGWGWMVVAGSFLNHLLFEGVVRSYGLIYMALLDRFHGTSASTAWIQATFNAVAMTTGPITGYLVEKSSCRIIVFIGGILLSVSLLASAHVQDLYFLYFTYSFIGGLGGGFVYSPMIVVVSQYFDRKRGKAMGLAALGGAVGTAAMPPIVGFLLADYGFTGCLIITSGIVLHHCIGGMLFRPLRQKQGGMEEHIVINEPLVNKNLNTTSVESGIKCDRLYGSSTFLREPNADIETASYSSLRILSTDSEYFPLRTNSLQCVRSEHVDRPSAQPLTGALDHTETYNSRKNNNLNYNQNSSFSKRSFLQNTRRLFSISREKLDAIRNLSFLLFCFNLFNIPTTIISTFIFLPGLAIEYGLEKSQAAILVSVIGASSALGRFSFGFMFDLPSIRNRRRLFHSFLGVLLGFATASLAMCGHFLGMVVVCVCVGISEGGVMAQRATALSQYVKQQQLTFAFGIMTMFQGFGNLLGPLLQGYLKDIVGTYSVCFYYGGGMTMLSSALLIGDYIIRSRLYSISSNRISTQPSNPS